ncbi:MAG: Protein fmp52, mitochondrial [Cirrosporium novae-zelandiae]|nr:MAG: Protein fmp52, mitochondrial [Cirrosporium novae-zelandiae]
MSLPSVPPFVGAMVGSTGLVGSFMTSTLLSLPQLTRLHAFARHSNHLPQSSKLSSISSEDSFTWPSQFPSLSPSPQIFFSALGTTRARVGSLENQRKIDYGLNLDMAKAAKEAGVVVYVLISSGGASPGNRFPYLKMKGELEESVKELGFEHTVIVRPGMLLGERRKGEERALEGLIKTVMWGIGKLPLVGGKCLDTLGQDGEAVGRAAVRVGVEALKDGTKGVRYVEGAELLKLGRDGWAEWVRGLGAQGEASS